MIGCEARRQLRGSLCLVILIGLSCVWAVFAVDQDVYPPDLVNFDFNPKQIDISSTDVQVTVTGQVTDETGVGWVTAGFEKGGGWTLGCSKQQFSGAKTANFSLTCTFKTRSEDYDGDWYLRINTGDTASPTPNQRDYYGLATLTVIHSGSPSGDNDAPVIESFSFSPTSVNVVASSATVTSRLRVTDETGVNVSDVWVNFISDDRGSITRKQGCTASAGSTPQALDLTCTCIVPLGAVSGNWSPDLTLKDTVGHTQRYNPPGILVVVGEDNTPPVLEMPSIQIVEANDGPGAWVAFNVSATDDVDLSPTVSCTPPAGSRFRLGQTTVNCTATDSSGNTASGSFVVEVRDTTPPVLNLPEDMAVEMTAPFGAKVGFFVTATDPHRVDSTPVVRCDPSTGSRFPPGNTAVTCTATDFSGNASSGSFTITVRDTTSPVLQLPPGGSIQAEAAGQDGTIVNFSVAASDAVDGSPTISCTHESGSLFPLGTTMVSCTASDNQGNSSESGSFTVIVVDTTPPTLVLPTNRTVEATSQAGAQVSFAASATDTVDAAPTIDCTHESGSWFELGSTTVTCTATDSSGNSSPSGSFTITVKDLTPPELVLPEDIVETTTESEEMIISFDARVTDDIDLSPTIECNPPSGSAFQLGVTTVHCTATDASGNSASGSFTVTVQQQAPPPEEQLTILTIEGGGTGTGRIASTETFISCEISKGGFASGVCSVGTSNTPATLVLTATASPGSVFESWVGCDVVSGPDGENCQITLESEDRTVTAIFQQEGTLPTLQVSGAGSGSGQISGSGISCNAEVGANVSGNCTITSSNPPLSLILTASASADSLFAGWTGCDITAGANNEICHVTLTFADRNVTAAFTRAGPLPRLYVEASGTGSGTISSPQITCNVQSGRLMGGSCSMIASEVPQTVILAANAHTGSVFGSWRGCDSTSGASDENCHITLDQQDRLISAEFIREGNLPQLLITGTGTGSGTIAGQGIVCNLFADGVADGNCSVIAENTPFVTTVTARALAGSVFGGWNECDSTTGSENEICQVTLDQTDRTVIAAFDLEPGPELPDDRPQPPDDNPEPPDENPEPAEDDDIQNRSGDECIGRTTATIILGSENIEDCLYLRADGYYPADLISVGDPPIEARQTHKEMQFSLEDAFMFEGNPTTKVRIEIDYFDRGDDHFGLAYPSIPIPPYYGRYGMASDLVRKGNTETWKTAIFILEDAYFNFPNDYERGKGDFNIDDLIDALSAGEILDREDRSFLGAEIIRRVSVTLLPESGAAGLPPEDRPCFFRRSASIVLGEHVEEDCLYMVGGRGADTEAVQVGDPPLWGHRTGDGEVLGSPRTNEWPDHQMFFQINDNVIFEGLPSNDVELEIEYFDQGYDDIYVFYDAEDRRDVRTGQIVGGPFSELVIHKADSGTWKTASFDLTNAFLGNRQWDSHLDFHIDDDFGSDIIRRITVQLL